MEREPSVIATKVHNHLINLGVDLSHERTKIIQEYGYSIGANVRMHKMYKAICQDAGSWRAFESFVKRWLA